MKTKKKKLVMTLGYNKSSPLCIPQQYKGAPFRWLGEVVAENDGGFIDEYEIEPDKKIFLSDFLTVISQKLTDISGSGVIDWGVKVYRV